VQREAAGLPLRRLAEHQDRGGIFCRRIVMPYAHVAVRIVDDIVKRPGVYQ
jgi:hypothetical protein